MNLKAIGVDIGTIRSFYETNLEMTDPNRRLISMTNPSGSIPMPVSCPDRKWPIVKCMTC